MKKKKRGSLAYQINQRMQVMFTPGKSKHEAKQVEKAKCKAEGKKWNPAKVDGIYSYKSFEGYKSASKMFVGWLKENHPDIKNIDDITKKHASDWLKQREIEGKSAYTVSRDMAALNKVLDMDLDKKSEGLKSRSYKDVVRGRKTPERLKYNPDNWRDQMDVVLGTGMRRASIAKVTAEQFIKDDSGRVIKVQLYGEKGGRDRIAPVRIEFQERVTEIVNRATDPDQTLLKKVTKHMNVHALRAEYARELYKEIIETEGHSGEEYRGYCAVATAKVSEALGHNRLSVVHQHYYHY